MPKMTPMKAIKKFCLKCAGSYSGVRVCAADDSGERIECPLYTYRLGYDPNRKKISPEIRAALIERLRKGKT